jgi:hypothetical protein
MKDQISLGMTCQAEHDGEANEKHRFFVHDMPPSNCRVKMIRRLRNLIIFAQDRAFQRCTTSFLENPPRSPIEGENP